MNPSETPDFMVDWLNRLNRAVPVLDDFRIHTAPIESHRDLLAAAVELDDSIERMRKVVSLRCAPWFEAST
jgi:hypothetical protein